jgi:hypothetical protein
MSFCAVWSTDSDEPGMALESWIEGIGTIRNTCIAPA